MDARAPRQDLTLSPVDRLTSREREILKALGRGRSDKEIAAEMRISVATVRKHIHNGIRALNANSRAHAIALLLGRPVRF